MQTHTISVFLRAFCRPAFFLFLAAASGWASEEQRVVEVVGPTPPPKVNAALPTLWVAGDSTAANGSPNATGWGKPLASFFDTTKINVANRARGGRSSKTFVHEGLWDQIVAELKAGDVVLIQFGHNDGGAIFTGKARASLPGLGEETEEGTLANGKKEIAHTFGWYMRKMIAETKAKGATPILLSLTIRQRWQDGKIERASGQYGEWSRELAKTEGTAFIDLSSMIADVYDAMGEEKLKAFFPQDYVHTSLAGADVNASLVVAALKTLRAGPLAAGDLYSKKGNAVLAAASNVFPAANPPEMGAKSKPLPEPANTKLPSLILIGDSTVRNGQGDGANGQWGWGEPLVEFFDTTKINVVNRAVGGVSSRTYLTSGHWERALALMKAGDFVIMQFGHNDNNALNDTSRARGTIHGVGDESEEIDNLLTKKHEVVHSYGWYLRRYIADARAKGATPIVCSLVPRKKWADGKIARVKESLASWAGAVAKAEGVAFIDLNERVAARYDALGEDKVNAFFADPHTHTSAAGARLNAECLIAGLQSLEKNPLAAFIVSPKAAMGGAAP